MICIGGLQGTGKTTNGKSTYGKSYHGSQSKDTFLENVITLKQNEGVLSEKQNEGEEEFNTADSVLEMTVKRATKQIIEIPVSEGEVLIWEARKVPSAEAAISYSFKFGEAGKVVLIIDNLSSKKKKVLYRFKTNPSSY
ncbi:hypothetical protein M0R45_026796 [Rubus argutus]|uniref:Uncharacterized protein n=1 Tax=Rubus argutus TaxID=59490 RepID=A0AAW1WYG9_RUBAR